MAKRKTKTLEEELQKQLAKTEEVKANLEAAKKEEADIVSEVKAKIDAIIGEHEMLCGVIIKRNEILELLKILLNSTADNIEIPYQIYIKETDDGKL